MVGYRQRRQALKRVHLCIAIIGRKGDGYVALCPELDIACQGDTVEEEGNNLTEALELFFESAGPSEIAGWLHNEVFVMCREVTVG